MEEDFVSYETKLRCLLLKIHDSSTLSLYSSILTATINTYISISLCMTLQETLYTALHCKKETQICTRLWTGPTLGQAPHHHVTKFLFRLTTRHRSVVPNDPL